jgi:hypothetical protein
MGLSFKSANGPQPKITFIREKQGSDSLICEQLSCFHVVVGRDLLKVVQYARTAENGLQNLTENAIPMFPTIHIAPAREHTIK